MESECDEKSDGSHEVVARPVSVDILLAAVGCNSYAISAQDHQYRSGTKVSVKAKYTTLWVI